MAMYCHHCGAVLQPDQVFCDRCGTAVASTDAMPSAAVGSATAGSATSGSAPVGGAAAASAFGGGVVGAAATGVASAAAPTVVAVRQPMSKEMKLGIAAAIAAPIAVALIVFGVLTSIANSALTNALSVCGYTSTTLAADTQLPDGMKNAVVEPYAQNGDYDASAMVIGHRTLGLTTSGIPDCVFNELGVPDDLMSRFGETSMSDGMQVGVSGPYTYSWYYNGSTLYTVVSRTALF